jgi:putative FmdB family regulatory protein
MPLYDYHCKSCHHDFELLVRTGDTPECPSCHGRDLERLLSSFAVNSADRRAASVKSERKRQVAGRRDAIVAEEEYRQKHEGH